MTQNKLYCLYVKESEIFYIETYINSIKNIHVNSKDKEEVTKILKYLSLNINLK